MLRILLVRPGATASDEQGRIKGSLDMPLSQEGSKQVEKMVRELANLRLDFIYCGPCESAQQTATALAKGTRSRWKILDELRNLDHGLWHGKRVDEIRTQQPRVYRQFQENPETVGLPGGESLSAAFLRLEKVIGKLFRKHDFGMIGLVVPEPLATLTKSALLQIEPGDLWKSQFDQAQWESLQVQPTLVGQTWS
jgi:broad specificity phosphatase PhoE